MPILADEETESFDGLLTETTPSTNLKVQGPFRSMIRREMELAEAAV